jgi:hypothetical protein
MTRNLALCMIGFVAQLMGGVWHTSLASECRAITDCSSGRCVATTVCGERPVIDQRLQRQYQDLEAERRRLIDEKNAIASERQRRREAQSTGEFQIRPLLSLIN